MSWRSYNWPSKATNEKSSASVLLKNATSPFLAASMKFFSSFISVCSRALGALSVFARPTFAKATLPHRTRMNTAQPYFIVCPSIKQSEFCQARQTIDAAPVLLSLVGFEFLQAFFLGPGEMLLPISLV